MCSTTIIDNDPENSNSSLQSKQNDLTSSIREQDEIIHKLTDENRLSTVLNIDTMPVDDQSSRSNADSATLQTKDRVIPTMQSPQVTPDLTPASTVATPNHSSVNRIAANKPSNYNTKIV